MHIRALEQQLHTKSKHTGHIKPIKIVVLVNKIKTKNCKESIK